MFYQFVPGELFLFFIYSFGDHSIIDSNKALYYKQKIENDLNKHNPPTKYKDEIINIINFCNFYPLIIERMELFFKEYDLKYSFYFSFYYDFLIFIDEENDDDYDDYENTYFGTQKKPVDINELFYEGFYN